MGSDLIDVEVYAPGMSVDGTRVSIPEFAQVLSLVAERWFDLAIVTLDGPPGVVPRFLIRFGPTGRTHDGYEVWEEIGREVMA